MSFELEERRISALEGISRALHERNAIERERLDKMFPTVVLKETAIAKARYKTKDQRDEEADDKLHGFDRWSGVGPRERSFLEQQEAESANAGDAGGGRTKKVGSKS